MNLKFRGWFGLLVFLDILKQTLACNKVPKFHDRQTLLWYRTESRLQNKRQAWFTYDDATDTQKPDWRSYRIQTNVSLNENLDNHGNTIKSYRIDRQNTVTINKKTSLKQVHWRKKTHYCEYLDKQTENKRTTSNCVSPNNYNQESTWCWAWSQDTLYFQQKTTNKTDICSCSTQPILSTKWPSLKIFACDSD